MTEYFHKSITKILESTHTLLTTGEIVNKLKEEYGIEISRQACTRNLKSLEKINVATYGLRGKKGAWGLKNYAEQEASQNFNKFKDKLSFDYTQLIEKWQNQLPVIISIWAGILQRSGYEHDEKIRYTGDLPLDVKNNPDFKKDVEDLLKERSDLFHYNPFTEWEKFDKKAKIFIERREKLLRDGVAEIIIKELVNKNKDSNQNIGVFTRVNEGVEIPMELVEGILYMLDTGVKRKSGEFSANWFNEFVRFDSIIMERPKSKSKYYCYHLKKLEETVRYSQQHDDGIAEIMESVYNFPRYYIFIASVQKEKQSRTNFKREMDKRVERTLKKIGQSKWIKEAILELWIEKEELFNILNNIHASLEKIKNIK